MESTSANPDAGDGSKKPALNRQKRKLEKDMTLEDLLVGWTQCCYLVPRKLKLCNIARTGSTLYCGNHQPTDAAAATDGATVDSGKERIPCPIDGSHTIFKRNLKQHVKVCTRQRELNAMASQTYFKRDCNSGRPLQNDSNTQSEASTIEPEALAQKVNSCFDRITQSYTAGDSPSSFLDGTVPANVTAMYDTLNQVIGSQLGQNLSAQSQLRHVEQDVLIAQQMIAHDLLSLRSDNTAESAHSTTSTSTSTNTHAVYVELGAGRGLLSQAVSCVDPSATVVLVERSGSRRKVDKAVQENLALAKQTVDGTEGASGGDSGGAVHRARMDIRHCYVPGLPGVRQKSTSALAIAEREQPVSAQDSQSQQQQSAPQPVVIIAKHLCGVATDLAIHSARSFPQIPRTMPISERPLHKVGISIATCCHHACHFPDYAGREWYLSQGFTVGEFEVLKKWSGWANMGQQGGHYRHGDGGEGGDVGDGEGQEGGGQATELVEGVTAEANAAADAGADAANDTTTQNSTSGNHRSVLRTAPVPVIRPSGITPEEMRSLGWKVKRILDEGRVQFIRSGYNMTARQVRYCARALSPECVMIVAQQQ